MKLFVLLLILSFITGSVFARHGKGGSIAYEYVGDGTTAGTSRYRITVKHYIDCDGVQFTEQNVFVGIFDGGTNALVTTLTIDKSPAVRMNKSTYDPCIYNKPEVCFYVVAYAKEVELPDNAAGYVLAEQECCRIAEIKNVLSSGSTGITNYSTIPGVINGVVYRKNSSPVYAQRDTAVICRGSYFEIDFSAVDEDGDQLTYSFCPAKSGGALQNRQPNPPRTPPYNNVGYASGYSAEVPLGSGVTLNGQTGLISGTAPATDGSYVISVCVSEFRNGTLINITKKEVQVTVADCNLSAAALKPAYINCNDYGFTFQNEAYSPTIDHYYWDFGVAGSSSDVSTEARPTFTYTDTGTYVLKLRVSSAGGCEDSATSKVVVYPGFSPGFTTTGSCFQTPFQFADTTQVRYGAVSSVLWDFGDYSSTEDASTLGKPVYQYTATGAYDVSLIVASSKGCLDTVTKTIAVTEKPFLELPFRDTLICSIDTLQLRSYGTGDFSWTPGTTISNVHIASPLVYPKKTTTYNITLREGSCVAQDSVRVNVLDFVTIQLPADTTVCKGDVFSLTPVSQALQYQWTPATGLSDATVKSPLAAPLQTTTYQLKASLGKCSAAASVIVNVAPYPQASAGRDTIICYGTPASLHAAVVASSFSWSPAGSLANMNTLQPVVTPLQTTAYVLTATDEVGCPKPVRDTVLVTVLPRVAAFAGNDTNVVAGQPLQLQASGGASYFWSPATGLNSTSIADPLASLSRTIDSITYVVVASVEGCSNADSITVKVFKTGADIFVPTAFTPNGDGKNDRLTPVPVGITRLEYFKVYNRWGQLVFDTDVAGRGWDGTIRGEVQRTNVFVFMVQGIDYTGRKLFKKGTFTLIR